MNWKNGTLESISNEFSLFKCGKFEAVIMNKNSYINLTKICSQSKTKNGNNIGFGHWRETSKSKEILDEVSRLTGIDVSDLLINIVSGNKNNTINRGTYGHPMLLTPIAAWISPKFLLKISMWLEEWKAFSKKNNLAYYEELVNLQPSHNLKREKQVQLTLQNKYDCESEVKTDSGRIDLMTDKFIIEIKDYYKWKNAIGQLFAYSLYYPEKKKCLYLFNVGNNDLSDIKKVCKKCDIRLKIYD